ncbi:MAG: hypothetical protein IRZ03_08455 [Acidobacterium ailaaui]|nr:hypothetical protein [Pseudacidobacterium ailaaui]
MNLKDLDALLASARRPETVVSICLRGDLQAEWETLDRKLNELRARHFKLAESKEERDLAKRIIDLEHQMAEATIHIKLRGLDRKTWRDLVAEHPVRKDNETDAVLGVNQNTFFDALIARCIVEPEMSEEQVSALLDTLTSQQFDKLAQAAWDLNRRDSGVPFSLAASQLNPPTAEMSKRRSGSASHTGGSRGGNRRR